MGRNGYIAPMPRRMVEKGHAPGWLVWAALIVVYVVWGSTYLAIAVVVKSMPPLLAAGSRFVIAGLVMAAVIALAGGWRRLLITRQQLIGAALVGIALLLGGNGLVMLAERTVPSGLAALIIAVVPLWIVLLRLTHSERVRRGTLLGVLIGFAGVALLVGSRGLTGEVDVLGMLMIVGSSASWALGSFYSRRMPLPSDPFVSTTAQMFVGGIALTLVGVATGEVARVVPAQFAGESLAALAYLIVFGSIVAFSAYTWLLQNAPVSKVATYAYVNPVVAIFLGWLILSESITASMFIGGAMIIAGVAVVIRTESRPARVAVLAGQASAAPVSRHAVRQAPPGS
jgi:drug/metabolite transporter (DMT)-like permease